MNKKLYKDFNSLLLLASLIFPIVAFFLVPSANSFVGNISIIGKIVVFLIYIIPTIVFILAIREFKKSDYKKSEFKISDFKSIKLEYVRAIFSFVIGIYFLLNSLYYIGIPIILISIEMLFITILNIRYCNKLIFSPWDNENRVSLETLSKYNKLKGLGNRITEAVILGIGIIPLTSILLNYFNLLGFNLIAFCSYAVSFFIYFMTTDAYKQILDNKFNDFVEYRGRCIKFEQSGKGAGGAHTFEVLNTDSKFVYIGSSKRIFRNGQVITLIIGMRSGQVINY